MSDFWTNDSADLCSLASLVALWRPSFFQITAVELQMQQGRENHQSRQVMYLLYNRIASCYNCLACVFKLLFFLPVSSDSRYWIRGTLLPKNLDPKVSNWLRNCSQNSMPSSCMMWTYYLQRICVRSMAAHLLMAMQYIWHQSGRALIWSSET